ncbi:hypothetical protein HDU83_008818 [Entophlyctis luteolus]|nr:hypothetical protein HDU83_008818 [Entophlyctis luteolus]
MYGRVRADAPVFEPTSLKPANGGFLDQFTTPLAEQSVWVVSSTKKVVAGIEDETWLKYRGEWSIEEPSVETILNDKGLVVKTAAALHAISAQFGTPVDTNGNTFVAQYEVKLQNGLECGGAYMKLLTYDPEFEPEKFSDKSPYTIMFGPDRCGTTNKVHFIFRHKNPVSGKIEEKHMDTAGVTAKADKDTHVYTLVVRPDNTFDVLVDGSSVKSGSLLEDFKPPVNPPAEIDDPEDKKPADWVDAARIPDPDATKPDDWDESAPAQIPDEDAEVPEDWLVDEPKSIQDPAAEKPEDWDDEEDGEWTAPLVPNPKCADVSGCGAWSRPMKANPAYKGKWRAPMIDNPAYKGVWAPRKIPNPEFFEDKNPSNMGKIGAVGFELWTMQNGILFDNVYIGHSEGEAKTLRDEIWAVKHKIEESRAPKIEEKSDKIGTDVGIFEKVLKQAAAFRDRLTSFIVRCLDGDYVEIAKEDPLAFGSIVTIALCVVAAIWTIVSAVVDILMGGDAKATVKENVKKAKELPVEKESSSEKKEVVDDEADSGENEEGDDDAKDNE